MGKLIGAERGQVPYDFFLEHSGKKVGYRVLRDQDVIQFREGLAPPLAPQVRQEAFDYTHVSPEIDNPIAFERWDDGAGFEDSRLSQTNRCTCYHYSRGIDPSWRNRLYLSPARQTLLVSSAEVAAAPAYTSRTTKGVFIACGRYLYEVTSSSALTLREDLGSGNAFTGPVVEHNGNLFAPTGDSDPYEVSTDGITWTQVATITDKNATKFVVRGQSSNASVLWKTNSTGALKTNTDGTSSGGEWSAVVQAGHTAYTVNSLVAANNDILVFKQDGLHIYDTAMNTIFVDLSLYRSYNGSHAVQWSDGKVYTSYGDRLMAFDPFANTGGIEFPWPSFEGKGGSEINGTITAFTVDADYIYFALKNVAGNTYIMKGTPGTGFHTIAYLGANDCNTMFLAPPADVHADNPSLIIGYGTAVRYFINVRQGKTPDTDANYRFDTTEGTLYEPWQDVGARGFKKFLNSGAVLGTSLTTGKYVTLLYEIDESADLVEIMTHDVSGYRREEITDAVEFNRVRAVIKMKTPSATVTPVMNSAILSCTLNNPRKRLWSAIVVLGNEERVGGGPGSSNTKALRQHLFQSQEERVFMYDRYGDKYRVRVLEIEGQGATGGNPDRPTYNVIMVEV